MAHLIIRTVYTSSELKSIRIMEENSAVCELVSGNQEWRPGFHNIYNVAPCLYGLKDELEVHLCRQTDDLFNLTNRIVLFGLTSIIATINQKMYETKRPVEESYESDKRKRIVCDDELPKWNDLIRCV